MTLNYPERAGYTEPSTSKEAADAIETSGKAPKLREEVLELLDQWDPAESSILKMEKTADEIAEFLGESILSVRPRVAELHKQGLIERTGERRPSSNGRASHVWRLCK